MSLNLAQIVANGDRYFPDQTALIHDDRSFNYHELSQYVAGFAREFQAGGIKPGDKVGLMAPNRPEFSVSYYALLHCGAVVVPLNILLVPEEVAYTLEDSEASALVVWNELGAGMEGCRLASQSPSLFVLGSEKCDIPDAINLTLESNPKQTPANLEPSPTMALTNSDDTAVILYTSGTTGKPKGAELTHSNLMWNAQIVSDRLCTNWPHDAAVFGPGHVGLAVLPLYHSFGQSVLQNAMLFGGATMVATDRFVPETTFSLIEKHKVTFFAGVPTMYFALLETYEPEKHNISSLKHCISGGAALPAELKKSFAKKFSIIVQEAYGLSETAPVACCQAIGRREKIGSIGEPVWGIEMIVADENCNEVPVGEQGEILIRGHNIMKGYYRRPDATKEAMRGGWFHSGDIGMKDDEGDFFVVDRKKDMIIRGGFNVYPREVEEVLYRHPAVREAAVVGVPDDKYGEEVKAVISIRSAVDPEEIIQFAKLHLAAFKYPRIIEIIDSLPKGPTGKILRRELR